MKGETSVAFKKPLSGGDPKYLGMRDTFIMSKCIGKKILHVGCTDWPFVEVSINNGTLLHGKLMESSGALIGIDIDEVGLSYLTVALPGLYIHGDLSKEEVRSKIAIYSADIILVPDVIEHVPNQYEFISGLLLMSHELQAQLIITTPNQYSLKAMLAALVGLDFTHTDHRLIHNQSTLQTAIAVDFNLPKDNIEIGYASRDITARYGRLMSLLSRLIDRIFFLKPYWADTIVVTIKAKT